MYLSLDMCACVCVRLYKISFTLKTAFGDKYYYFPYFIIDDKIGVQTTYS